MTLKSLGKFTGVFASLLAGLLWVGDAWAVRPMGKQWKQGDWVGNSYIDENNGRFNHCQMYHRYGADILIFSISASGVFRIGLRNLSWDLPVSQNYQLGVLVDQKNFGRLPAKTRGRQTIVITPTQNAKAVLESIKQGNVLQINAQQQNFRFNLKGSAAALQKLEACVRAGRTGNNKKNPFGGSQGSNADNSKNPFGGNNGGGNNGSNSGGANNNAGNNGGSNDIGNGWRVTPGQNNGTNAQMSDGMKLAYSIIRKINDPGFRIVRPVPATLQRLKADAVWAAPRTIGAINTLPGRYRVADLERAIANSNRKNCRGQFRSSHELRTLVGRTQIPVVKIGCTESVRGKPYFINYAFYPRKGNQTYRILHSSVDPDAANAADFRVFSVIQQMLLARRQQ